MDAKTLNALKERCAEPEVQRAIRVTVNTFCRRNYDLDRDEVLGEAQLIALDLCRWFNGEGRLPDWVAWGLKRRLAKLFTENPAWVRKVRKATSLDTLQYTVPAPSHFDLNQLLWQVSQDARFVLEWALRDSNPALRIFRVLRVQGWSERRVLGVFREIREALGYVDRVHS